MNTILKAVTVSAGLSLPGALSGEVLNLTPADPPNNGRTGNITVASGETDNTNDAGIIVPATIRGTLFEDTNADGQEADESCSCYQRIHKI